jgi:glycosyltransferase involved in cell wall biosynthesis
MKIACIGNMNNALFCVVRNLRDLGYDAHLFLVEEFEHFLPLADSVENTSYDYIHQLNWYNIGHWAIRKEQILKDLKGYDFFIGTDLAPAFLYKAGIKLDIFTPHGGDIFHHCFYSFKNFPPKRYEIGSWWRSVQQRKGARNAGKIMFDYSNDFYETYFVKARLTANRLIMNAPYIYNKQYKLENFVKNPEFDKAKAYRDKYDLIFFSQIRHCWKTNIHYKANDRLIHGYASFLNQNKESNTLLILFEYGWDFEESKKLVTQLGIDKHVLWLPTMQRKDLMVWLYFADLGIGEFGESFLTYGSVLEILSMKKPFLGYRRDEDFTKYYPELYPMLSANTADLISEALTDVYKNPSKYREMGEKGYEWFMKYAIEKPINEIAKQIEAKK